MNKILPFIIAISIFSSISVNGQKDVIEYNSELDHKTLHFGFYLGMNQKDFKINYTQTNTFVEVEPSLGFNIGIIGGWRINKNVTLRLEPGLSSNTKILAFTNIEGGERDSIRKIGGTFLRVPLLLKLNTNRVKPADFLKNRRQATTNPPASIKQFNPGSFSYSSGIPAARSASSKRWEREPDFSSVTP